MKKRIFLIFISILVLRYLTAQEYCEPKRFDFPYLFNEVNKDSNILYVPTIIDASNWTCDVYVPKSPIDNSTKRPFIMFIHGGGFQTGDKRDEAWFCEKFAMRGFVTVSVNYRLSKTDPSNLNLYAGYKAHQDINSALKFFRQNADGYKIDTNNMFLAGESAGAMTALSVAFISQTDWNNRVPGIETELGSLNNGPSPKGIISMWGAIANPDFISEDEAKRTPILMFHGIDDDICPYDSMGEVPNRLYGSKRIAERYENFSAPYHLYFGQNLGHGTGFRKDYLEQKMNLYFVSVFCDIFKKIKKENISKLKLFQFSLRRTLNVEGYNFSERIIITFSSMLIFVIGLFRKDGFNKVVSGLLLIGIISMWFMVPYTIGAYYYFFCLLLGLVYGASKKDLVRGERIFIYLLTILLFLRYLTGTLHLIMLYYFEILCIIPIIWSVILLIIKKPRLILDKSFIQILLIQALFAFIHFIF